MYRVEANVLPLLQELAARREQEVENGILRIIGSEAAAEIHDTLALQPENTQAETDQALVTEATSEVNRKYNMDDSKIMDALARYSRRSA